MSSQINSQELAQELAETLNDSVIHYCSEISGDSYIDCLYTHSPENLDDFADSYLEDELGEEELDKIWENADGKFWEAFKKEYRKLWMEDLELYTVGVLEDIIEDGLKNIVNNGNLAEKVYLLERYKNVLNELRNAIVNAINTQTPLSYDKLYEYILKLYKIARLNYYDNLAPEIEDAMFIDCNDYNDNDECVVDFLIHPYGDLDKDEKLTALEELLGSINRIQKEYNLI